MIPFFSRTRSLRVDILTAFVGLLLATVVLIVGYNCTENSRATKKLADDLVDQVTAWVIEETADHLMPACRVAEISARIEREGFSILNNKSLETHALAALQAHSQFVIFGVGDEQGNYLMAIRQADKTLSTQIINATAQPPTQTWRHWDASGNVAKVENSSDVTYDPRSRPWYEGAKKTGKLFWTDIYIFHSTARLGITASSPIFDPAGKLVGVVGVDIEMEEMSRFLRSLKIGLNGVAFIMNEKEEVVAYPDLSQAIKDEAGVCRPTKIGELEEPWVRDCCRMYRATGASDLIVKSGGRRYVASFAPFSEPCGKSWTMGVVVPEEDFVGILQRAHRVTLLISAAVLILAIAFSVLLSKSISQPIVTLAQETKRIKDFHLDEKTSIISHITEIQLMSSAISAMRAGLQAFRRYVPAGLVRQLIRTGQDARLGGQKKELTLLFTDISGFSGISERTAPEELMLHLSEYFDELTQIIMAQQGTVDKYIGDGIMAFWGAPVSDEQHADHACRAALLCYSKVQEINRDWQKEGKVPFPTRFGIHTGDSIVGNMGSTERMNYSVLGDAVNLASRLQSVNKVYGTWIMISEATRSKLSDSFLCRPLDRVAVAGKAQGIRIYELVAQKGDPATGWSPAREELCLRFAEGFEAYLKRDWEGAARIFKAIAKKTPDDRATKTYVERCASFQANPPRPDWDGTVRLERK